MVFVFVFLVCFFASVVGAICGIGGGVIIKPALDAFHIMDVSTISFLSGCTVLSMSCYSVAKSMLLLVSTSVTSSIAHSRPSLFCFSWRVLR